MLNSSWLKMNWNSFRIFSSSSLQAFLSSLLEPFNRLVRVISARLARPSCRSTNDITSLEASKTSTLSTLFADGTMLSVGRCANPPNTRYTLFYLYLSRDWLLSWFFNNFRATKQVHQIRVHFRLNLPSPSLSLGPFNLPLHLFSHVWALPI